MLLSHLGRFASLLCIDLVALAGNICMIIIGIRYKPLRKFQNAFIFNVALADLLQAIIIMPSSLASVIAQKWLLGKRTCDAFAILKTTITLASIFSLSGISLQRYFYVVRKVRPLDSKRYTVIAVAVVWLCSFCLSVTPLFGWGVIGYSNDRQVCTFFFHKTASHTLTVFTLGLFVNVLVMVFCYTSIFLTLRTSRRSLHAAEKAAFPSTSLDVVKFNEVDDIATDDMKTIAGATSTETLCDKPEETYSKLDTSEIRNGNQGIADSPPPCMSADTSSKEQIWKTLSRSPKAMGTPGLRTMERSAFSLTDLRGESKITRKELRLLKTIFVVVAVFISCWLPYVTFNLLRLFKVITGSSTVDTLTMWLGFLNSAANPVLYGVLNTQFRKAMKQTVLMPIQQCQLFTGETKKK